MSANENELAVQIAELRADVRHVQSDMVEIKADIREMNGEIRATRAELWSAKIWALGLCGTLLLVMARGFKWI